MNNLICLNQDIQDLRMYRIEFFKSCYIWTTQIPILLGYVNLEILSSVFEEKSLLE